MLLNALVHLGQFGGGVLGRLDHARRQNSLQGLAQTCRAYDCLGGKKTEQNKLKLVAAPVKENCAQSSKDCERSKCLPSLDLRVAGSIPGHASLLIKKIRLSPIDWRYLWMRDASLFVVPDVTLK